MNELFHLHLECPADWGYLTKEEEFFKSIENLIENSLESSVQDLLSLRTEILKIESWIQILAQQQSLVTDMIVQDAIFHTPSKLKLQEIDSKQALSSHLTIFGYPVRQGKPIKTSSNSSTSKTSKKRLSTNVVTSSNTSKGNISSIDSSNDILEIRGLRSSSISDINSINSISPRLAVNYPSYESQRPIITRIALIYCHSLKKLIIPLKNFQVTILKILIFLNTANLDPGKTFILKHFVVSCVDQMFHLLPLFGSSILTLILKSKLLSEMINSDLLQRCKFSLEDIVNNENALKVGKIEDVMIRNFRDVDNRNNYRSQIEVSIYNERERIYDVVNYLFRRFQELNLAELQGWIAYTLEPELTKFSGIHDANLISLAVYIVDMIDFYCSKSPKHNKDDQQYRINMNNETIMTFPKNKKSKDNYLWERYHYIAASDYVGYTQFFFWFFLQFNNSKFNKYVYEILVAKLLDLSLLKFDKVKFANAKSHGELKSITNSALLFSNRVIRLRFYGKLLGFLSFSHRWSPSTSNNDDKPVQLSGQLHAIYMQQYEARNSLMLIDPLPLLDLIGVAVSQSKLSLSIVWIKEYLFQSRWDTFHKLHLNESYGDLKSYLRRILYLKSFSLSESLNSISANRLYSVILIQDIFGLFNDSSIIIDDKHQVPCELIVNDQTEESLDDGDGLIVVNDDILDLLPSVTTDNIKLIHKPGTSVVKSKQSPSSPTSLRSPVSTTTSSKLLKSPKPSMYNSSTEVASNPHFRKLEKEFWQQHNHLNDISEVFTQHAYQSRLLKLKDLVVDAVRKMWSYIASLKTEISADKTRFLNEKSNVSTILVSQANKIRKETILIANESIVVFSTHIETALEELFGLYQSHSYVKDMAKYLTLKQCESQNSNLLDYLKSYTRRKLDEVIQLGVKQLAVLLQIENSVEQDNSDKIGSDDVRDNNIAQNSIDLNFFIHARDCLQKYFVVTCNGNVTYTCKDSDALLTTSDNVHLSSICVSYGGSVEVYDDNKCNEFNYFVDGISTVLDFVRSLLSLKVDKDMDVKALFHILVKIVKIWDDLYHRLESEIQESLCIELSKYLIQVIPLLSFYSTFPLDSYLFQFNECNLVSHTSIIKVFTLVGRRSTGVYYESLNYLENNYLYFSKREYFESLLLLIGTYFKKYYKQLHLLSFEASDKSEVIWYTNVDILDELQNVYGAEVHSLILQLTKYEQLTKRK